MSFFESKRFQRSVNVAYDLTDASRISHFRPTSKSVRVINAICGRLPERAFMTIAAYGTGKSIAAAFSAHATMSVPHSNAALAPIINRLQEVQPDLAKFITDRSGKKKSKGLVLALEGFQENLVESLREAVKSGCQLIGVSFFEADKKFKSPIAVLECVTANARSLGIDTVSVIWDEFGRHLEGLVTKGRASELSALQQLAEFANRQEAVKTTLMLLLHQGFFQYSGNLPQSIRNEWKKIEGRFESIQYVDDSREMYRLLADIVSALRPATSKELPDFRSAAKQAQSLGFFKSIDDLSELEEILRKAYPLDPATLYMVPRLSARVAQNERTLFSFIQESDLSGVVSLSALYNYFAPAMHADTAPGGTYRQWLETESALSKANTVDEEDALKAACLLSLGLSGQRIRIGFDGLLCATRGYDVDREPVLRKTIGSLIERKLLLHRKHSDEVSVWHGTDIDLRKKLEELKQKHKQDFDLINFLRKEYPAPAWQPVEYNCKYAIRRYYVGEYVEASTLIKLKQGGAHPVWELKPGQDGKVIYALAHSQSEINAIISIAQELSGESGCVLAVPREPLRLLDTAVEVSCLSVLQGDHELTSADPLIIPELQQMADDARLYLASMIDRILIPSDKGPAWFSNGVSFKAASRGQLRRKLSILMEERFGMTPVIHSEAAVRTNLTRPMVNARKKLILGILERTSQLHFGIEGTTPDASLYRTVLLHTKLVSETEAGGLKFAKPEELADRDRGLGQVWNEIRMFLVEPAKESKSLATLFETLQDRPYGLRAGLIPILLAAGLKAFPSALTISKRGAYLADILAGDIEDICKNPTDYSVNVYALDKAAQDYLKGLLSCFSDAPVDDVQQGDLIREVYDAIENWKIHLPDSALTTTKLDQDARAFQRVIRHIDDPAKLIFEQFHAIAKQSGKSESTLKAINRCKAALEGVVEQHAAAAIEKLRKHFTISANYQLQDIRQIAFEWGQCFAPDFVDRLQNGSAKAVIRFSQNAKNHASGIEFVNKLASIIVSKALNRWNDQTPGDFERALGALVREVEEEALAHNKHGEGSVRIVRGRLETLYSRLVEVAGKEEAKQLLLNLAKN